MPTNTLDVIVRLKDEATTGLKRISSSFTDLRGNFDGAVKASHAVALGLAGIGTAAIGFGTAAVMSANNMEQMQIAFTTMLGSAENAKSFMADLIKFAKETPFELKGLQQSSSQLMAYGFQQKEILPNLKALGDIAAGVGMDKLPNLILAFGQVKAATKLTGMELRQFTEAGVPMLEELSKVMKKPVAEIQKMVSEGKIGFKEVQQALMNLTGEGGRFNNLMANQMETVGGKISNLKDTWNIFLAQLGNEFLPMIKKIIDVLIPFVTNILPQWIEKTKEVIKWLDEHKIVLFLIAGAITGALIPSLLSLIATLAAGAIALAPYMIGGMVVAGVIAGILWIVKHFDKIKEVLIIVKDAFVNEWNEIKRVIGSVVDWIGDKIKELLKLLDKVQLGVEAVMNIPGVFGEKVSGVASKVGGAVKGFLGFQEGGIVPGPIGRPIPAIVHGGETVIPYGGRGNNFIFNFQGAFIGNIESFKEELIRLINRQTELKAFGGK